MLNIISTEFLKMKRKKTLLLFCVTFIIDLLMVLNSTNNYIVDFMENFGFATNLFGSYPYITFLIHPIVLGIFGTSLFVDEHKNNTFRQLAIIPVSKGKLFLSKVAVVSIMSLVLAISYLIILDINQIFTGIYKTPMDTIIKLHGIILLDACTLTLAIIPVLFIASIAQKNFILPIVSCIIYHSLILIPSINFDSISEINSFIFKTFYPMGIVGFISNFLMSHAIPKEIFPFSKITENVSLKVVILLSFSILFTLLSIEFMKKQDV